jgi:hypothetical protein
LGANVEIGKTRFHNEIGKQAGFFLLEVIELEVEVFEAVSQLAASETVVDQGIRDGEKFPQFFPSFACKSLSPFEFLRALTRTLRWVRA